MKLLSIRDAASRLSVSRSTLYRLIAAGTITTVRISPRRVGIRESDLALLFAPHVPRIERMVKTKYIGGAV